MYRGDVGARGDRLLDGALNDHVGRWLAQRIADVRRYCLEVCGGVDGENEMLDACCTKQSSASAQPSAPLPPSKAASIARSMIL